MASPREQTEDTAFPSPPLSAQAFHKGGARAAHSQAEIPTPSTHSHSAKPGVTMRKSCDFCFKRKKRCDGNGANRCSYCSLKGQPECVYSQRQKRRTKNQQNPLVAESATDAAMGFGGYAGAMDARCEGVGGGQDAL